MSVGLAASGCNMASHYESAANVGASRVELTPQFKDTDDTELMARLGNKPAARVVDNKGRPLPKRAQPAPKRVAAFKADKIEARALESAYSPPTTPKTVDAQALRSTVDGRSEFASTYDSNVLALNDAFTNKEDYHRTVAEIENTVSARCRRILAETGIATTLLRSPTITANIDTSENYGIAASYDFVDLQRANLQEELAIAQCYRAAVSVKLTQLLVTSTQSLTRAGFLAKANALRKARRSFVGIRGRINTAVNDGTLTMLRATTLRQYMDQISTGEARARGEAARREVVDRILNRSFKDLDRQLVAAEARIHDIEARARTADAIKVRGQVSYGGQTDLGLGTNQTAVLAGGRNTELRGTLQVSVRLGAFSKRRHELEEVARSARQAQHLEKDSGVLWRAGELARANKRVLANLRKQRQDIVRALKQAQSNSRRVNRALEDDLLMPQLRARIDVLALKANLAGLDATIADTVRIERKLKFKN